MFSIFKWFSNRRIKKEIQRKIAQSTHDFLNYREWHIKGNLSPLKDARRLRKAYGDTSAVLRLDDEISQASKALHDRTGQYLREVAKHRTAIKSLE